MPITLQIEQIVRFNPSNINVKTTCFLSAGDKVIKQNILNIGRDKNNKIRIKSRLWEFLYLKDKYASVPMSLADACLVRMSETLPEPVVLTTDADFKIYRRHSRRVVPCLLP